ncbi:PLP-dependent transferase [Comamonas sp.]|uniref:PLP-dependent transferase n=1 Tax=Comamonas sp. TaxID=34028 RepID=UPI0028A21384|nr:PLP-dependent transferase [Comamonas sp.]
MSSTPKNQAPITGIIHHPYTVDAPFAAPQPGVFKASSVFFPNVAAMRNWEWKDKSAFTYGLHGTPTTYILEERIATLEGGTHCVLVPSGLASVSVIGLALLKSGDHVLLPDNVYGPSKGFAESELQRYGVSVGYYDPMRVDHCASLIQDNTRLVWLEAAGSVSMEFPDLVGLVRLCRQKGIATALDNTWGAGLAFNCFDLDGDGSYRLGVDVSAHALTKYPSGGGDVLMGSIVTRDAAVHRKVQATHMHLGLGVGVNDIETVLRSLPSIALRYHAQDAAARQLAAFMAEHPAVVQLLHPAFAGSPGHAHWQQLCGAGAVAGKQGTAAGLFSVVIDPRYSQKQVDLFCESLRLFKLAYSWGGPVSLVVPYKIGSMRALGESQLQPGMVVRFAIGLEDANDLQQDLAQALQKAFG